MVVPQSLGYGLLKDMIEDKNFSFSKMEGGFENSSSNNTGKKEYAPQQEDDGVDEDLPF